MTRGSHLAAFASSIAALACTPSMEPSASAAPQQPNEPAKPATGFTPPDASGYGRAAGLAYFEEVVGGAGERASAQDPLPLVILLHGRGDEPSPGWLPISPPRPVRVVMPRAPTAWLEGYTWFEYRAAEASDAELAGAIGEASDRLAAAIEVIRTQRPTVGTPFVAGFSQGGMLTFALAVRHPHLLSVAVPFAGLLPDPLLPAQQPVPAPQPGVALPKIRAAHGTEDDLVPFERGRRTVSELAARGYDATLLEEPGTGHSITPRMLKLLNRELAAAFPR